MGKGRAAAMMLVGCINRKEIIMEGREEGREVGGKQLNEFCSSAHGLS